MIITNYKLSEYTSTKDVKILVYKGADLYMKTLIEGVFFTLKGSKLFILVLIGQLLVLFTTKASVSRNTHLIQFLNGHNFSNYVIMAVIFIIVISKLVDMDQIGKGPTTDWKLTGAKKHHYILKLIYLFKLMIFSSCICFLGLLIIAYKISYLKFPYILMLKQSFYPLFGYLPFFVLQFSILMLINKKGVSFACGVIGYFMGVLGSVGISMKAGVFDIWAYPFYTAPVITDSEYGISIENDMSIVLIIISIVISAAMIAISLYLCNKQDVSVSENRIE